MVKQISNAVRYAPPEGYYELTKNRTPSKFLKEAVELFAKQSDRTALDFGCGAGSETRFILENGFFVTAVDGYEQSKDYIKKLPHSKKVKFIHSEFEAFKFGKYDLINARYSLSFVHKDVFKKVFAKLKKSINPGGVFVGNFYGVNDQWNKLSETMTFLTREQIEELFSGMEIIKLEEKDEDGKIANGTPKHIHLFSVIARQPE